MKKLLIVLLIGLILVPGFSQSGEVPIKVSDDIELIKISDNAYIHVSYMDLGISGRVASNGLIFINGKDAFLFDTPMTDSLTKCLVSWIMGSMKLRIAGFVPNHWHADCMGGLAYLQSQKIESYANQITIDIAKSKNLPVPGQGFNDSLQLQLGDKSIHCYYPGAAHSMDNIVVWIPSEQILFAGCMAKSLNTTNLGNTADSDLVSYPKTIETLIHTYPTAKIVIPGHGQSGGLDLLTHTYQLSNR